MSSARDNAVLSAGCDTYRRKCFMHKRHECYSCGKEEGYLEVHHITGNRGNNTLDNLIPLCKSCHGKAHRQPESRRLVLRKLQELYNNRVWDTEPDHPVYQDNRHLPVEADKVVVSFCEECETPMDDCEHCENAKTTDRVLNERYPTWNNE